MTRFVEDVKLDFKDVLLRPKRSRLKSRSEVDLTRKFVFPHSGREYSGLPIIAANMDGVGTMAMARAFAKFSMSVALHKHYPEKELKGFFGNIPKSDEFSVAYSMGITADDMAKFKSVRKKLGKRVGFVCVDVANGYSQGFVDFVSSLRSDFPDIVLMAGNVVTGEMTEELILRGVDIVKVGIGSGSVCTTRKMTGVGYPQLSAILECADAAHGLDGLICSDGGCTQPGDVAKAFAAGADFVMLGGMLAAHEESETESVEKEGERFLKFYGMSSSEAMTKHSGGVAEYRASEGKVVLLPSRGPVEDTVKSILGGVRSACTYIGAKTLKQMPKCATFVRVTQQLNEVFGKS